MAEPLIVLEPGGKAPFLSYNIPEPTSYSGRNYIELDYPAAVFTEKAFERPADSVRAPLPDIDPATMVATVEAAMHSGFADRRLFPNVRLRRGDLRLEGAATADAAASRLAETSAPLATLAPAEVAANMASGRRLNIYKSLYGTLTYNYIKEPTEPRPRLLLVETYGLSSFLGSYGAGRIIKTFSLLPGERAKVSVKTYLRTEQSRKSASSILDSFTQESADSFESSVQEEQSDRTAYEESFEYHAEAEAKAGWGWGSAKVSGGVKGGTNSAREEFAKNVSAATAKHAATASAKRDVHVDTSFEVKEEAGQETSIERQIENINVSRTLNYVFRQMNQEFITLLHLVDVRVAFFNGFSESRREVPISRLDELLGEMVVEDKRAELRAEIVSQLETILDYRDQRHGFVEQLSIAPGDTYTRVRRGVVSTYRDDVTGTEVAVPGIILSAVKSVLRTEGLVVEALLGQGDALDAYAARLQELEVERREVELARSKEEVTRAVLSNEAVHNGDAARVSLLEKLECPCGDDAAPIRLAVEMRKSDHEPGPTKA